MTEYAVVKTGEYLSDVQVIFLKFSNDATCCGKSLKDNKQNNPHLALKNNDNWYKTDNWYKKLFVFSRQIGLLMTSMSA